MEKRSILDEERRRIGTDWGRGVDPWRFPIVEKYAGRTVLDVGCGSGAYVEALNRSGRSAVGLDMVPTESWRRWHLNAVVGDAAALPFADGSFETVLALEVLEHCPNARHCLSEMARVASRNVVVSVPDCEVPAECAKAGLVPIHWIDRSHSTLFTEKMLRDTLAEAGLRVIHFKRINATYPEILVLRAWPLLRVIEKPICMLADWFTVRGIRKPLYGCMITVAQKQNEAEKGRGGI